MFARWSASDSKPDMTKLSWLKLARVARLAWVVSAILAAGVLAHAQLPTPIPTPMPTPSAAGATGNAKKPLPIPDEPDDPADAPIAKLDENGKPEPFFCEFSWIKNEDANSFHWVNTGSDYPRMTPPVTKLETLSLPFSRSKGMRGPAWGTCAEVDESTEPSELNVILHIHTAKTKTVPDGDTGRCRWITSGPIFVANSRFKIRVGGWAGVEFTTQENERKRFSVHWPEVTQSDSDGSYCRGFASQMNKSALLNSGFKALKPSVQITTEENAK